MCSSDLPLLLHHRSLLSLGAKLQLKLLLHHRSLQQKERRKWLLKGRNWVSSEGSICGRHYIPVCEVQTHFILLSYTPLDHDELNLCMWGVNSHSFAVTWGWDSLLSCTYFVYYLLLWNHCEIISLQPVCVNVHVLQLRYTTFFVWNMSKLKQFCCWDVQTYVVMSLGVFWSIHVSVCWLYTKNCVNNAKGGCHQQLVTFGWFRARQTNKGVYDPRLASWGG